MIASLKTSKAKNVDWLDWAFNELRYLEEEEAKASVEFLLSDVLEIPRSQLYLSDTHKYVLDSNQERLFRDHIEKRKQRIPVAYILGHAAFRDEELFVSRDCLIPRPETELLVEYFIKECGFHQHNIFNFLDIGTGSGAIAISLLRYFDNAHGTMADISKNALKIAQRNLNKYDLSHRADIVCSDMFHNLKGRWNVIFSNPPYIKTGDVYGDIEAEVMKEPLKALDGGEDGLHFYREIISQAPYFLTNRGWIALEIGAGQGNEVEKLLEESGFESVKRFKDYSGFERVLIAQLVN